jgi:2-methylcitrate dehydratase PrpD
VAATGVSLTEQLAERLLRPVDARARARAATCVLDWLAAAVAARRYPVYAQLATLIEARGAGAASALGLGTRAPEHAILLNGALGNVLEMDDVHRSAILHPGPIAIPAALAAAEHASATATALLDAIVRGYEATIRIGRALGPSHYRYFHSTSSAGAFGAAAAVASILELDADRCADALGNAGTRTGGLWQLRHEDVPSKSLHNAEAAFTGWLAAELAARGFRGPRAILEGPQGLFAATAPAADAAEVNAEAGDWLLHEVSVKPWPACRHAHPAIDAMLAAWPAGADGGAIERIVVHTYREAIAFCDRPQPASEIDAKFSLQHALASIVLNGRPVLAHYVPEALAAPALAALRQRVSLAVDEAIAARFPRHYGARVEVVLADGRVLEAAVRDAFGDPELPLDEPAMIDKARMLMAWGGASEATAARLIEAALALPDAIDLRGLGAALAELAR